MEHLWSCQHCDRGGSKWPQFLLTVAADFEVVTHKFCSFNCIKNWLASQEVEQFKVAESQAFMAGADA